jgi:peptidoglycan/xylan/chitin deacetylase (PgdA/CDA1 family)
VLQASAPAFSDRSDSSLQSRNPDSMLKVPIFYYHSIGNQGPETFPIVQFRQHLDLLRQQRFKPITFSELLALDPDDANRYVVLSFDDGLLDNFENAAPILNEFGYKATFFVIPGFDDRIRWVNPKTRAWSETKAAGFSIPFPSMNKHHRRQLLESGMEIGCHSMTHPKLNQIPEHRLELEISDSKALLEDQLGAQIKTFCYPKGRYNNKILDKVRIAGYSGACTTMPAYYGIDTPKFECGRFLVENHKLFLKILDWAAPTCTWTDPLCAMLRPPLKLKNTCF